MKKIDQLGVLSLHVILPLAIAIAAIAGIGTYVLKKSGASADANTGAYNSCGVLKHNGNVYAAAVSTQSKFSGASSNDSIRNIAYGLCKLGYLDNTAAQAINSSGNYDAELQKSFSRFQIDNPTTGTTDGVPTAASLTALKLTPIGF
jgi:uncharacterized protein (UPF0333 family)